jgi:hypothetical protein
MHKIKKGFIFFMCCNLVYYMIFINMILFFFLNIYRDKLYIYWQFIPKNNIIVIFMYIHKYIKLCSK